MACKSLEEWKINIFSKVTSQYMFHMSAMKMYFQKDLDDCKYKTFKEMEDWKYQMLLEVDDEEKALCIERYPLDHLPLFLASFHINLSAYFRLA